jgi:nicotinamidase-related amidase
MIISGGAVDIGVASTVYSARDHDYNVIIVRDACSTPMKIPWRRSWTPFSPVWAESELQFKFWK